MQLGWGYLYDSHCWLVITLPAADGSVVVVNFTTWDDYLHDEDEYDVFVQGWHPFLTNPKSTIDWLLHQVLKPTDTMARNMVRKPEWDLSPAMLAAIQANSDCCDLKPATKRRIEESSRQQAGGALAAAPAPAPVAPVSLPPAVAPVRRIIRPAGGSEPP